MLDKVETTMEGCSTVRRYLMRLKKGEYHEGVDNISTIIARVSTR